MPAASTVPGRQGGERVEGHPPGLGHGPAGQLGRQRVPRSCRPESREPTSPGIRGLSSQARATATQRVATSLGDPGVEGVGRDPHRVAVGVGPRCQQAGAPRRPPPAAPWSVSSTWRWAAAALSSRTPRPPLRSAAAGWVPQWSRSSSIAAYRLEGGAGAGPVDDRRLPARRWRSRGSCRPARGWCARRAATSPTSPGSDDEAAGAGHQQAPREQLLGRRLGVVGQHRLSGGAGGGLAALGVDVLEQCAGGGRQRGEVSGHLVGRRRLGLRGRSPLRSVTSDSATPVSGRIPPGASQARARPSSRSSAASTCDRSACTMRRSSDGVVWPATTRASRTKSSSRVRMSRARTTRGAQRGAGRKLSEVVRGGSGQVGTLDEQPGQPLVRPALAAGRRANGTRAAWPSAQRYPAAAARWAADDPRSSCTTAPPPTSGVVREVNEDAFLVAPPVFVVADGMGGHDRGDVASRIVVEEFGTLADEGYDPAAGPRWSPRRCARCQRPDRRLRRRAARSRGPRLRGRHDRGRGAADRAGGRAEVAAGQPR